MSGIRIVTVKFVVLFPFSTLEEKREVETKKRELNEDEERLEIEIER